MAEKKAQTVISEFYPKHLVYYNTFCFLQKRCAKDAHCNVVARDGGRASNRHHYKLPNFK